MGRKYLAVRLEAELTKFRLLIFFLLPLFLTCGKKRASEPEPHPFWGFWKGTFSTIPALSLEGSNLTGLAIRRDSLTLYFAPDDSLRRQQFFIEINGKDILRVGLDTLDYWDIGFSIGAEEWLYPDSFLDASYIRTRIPSKDMSYEAHRARMDSLLADVHFRGVRWDSTILGTVIAPGLNRIGGFRLERWGWWNEKQKQEILYIDGKAERPRKTQSGSTNKKIFRELFFGALSLLVVVPIFWVLAVAVRALVEKIKKRAE